MQLFKEIIEQFLLGKINNRIVTALQDQSQLVRLSPITFLIF